MGDDVIRRGDPEGGERVTVSDSSMKAAVSKLRRKSLQATFKPASLSFASRSELVASSQASASHDERFRNLVNEADRLRDNREWQRAEAAYASALALYPYQCTYWTQHGHMAKEQSDFVRAEVSYRTACALGALARDVEEHLLFVMGQQHIDPGKYPIRYLAPGPTAEQVPARPDAILLARLVWRVGGVGDLDLVELLRSCATCDQLLARMIADPRFERANRDWLELVREGEL